MHAGREHAQVGGLNSNSVNPEQKAGVWVGR